MVSDTNSIENIVTLGDDVMPRFTCVVHEENCCRLFQ
jgi:hypothetical protein